ncbi:MAG TPA: TonB-dependent receptor [Thermoanaerobaculia bacterium]|jgi:vitamin B12 transporter|nr:TonB-dependent receptor [Thermoanaerobaculia bacterium]
MKRVLALSLFFVVPALAQSTPQQPPQTINDQIVVTASALPETVQATPASVTVITRTDIDEHAALDVADVLRDVPGLVLARSGSPGKATSLFTRGAASTQTLVLWNGIVLNNPYFSGYDWGRFSTAGVEQIEVVRGPFSALYGSEAMAGVINVTTTPRTSGIHGDFESGSHGLRNAMLDGAYASETLTAAGSYEHRSDDGFNPNDDFHQNSASANARWTPIDALSIGAAARHTSYNLGIPFNTNADGSALVPSPDRRQNGTETQIAIPVTLTLGRFISDLTLSDNHRLDDFHDPQDPFTTSTSTDAKTRRARLTTRVATPIGTIVAGGEYSRDLVNDLTNFGPNFLDKRRTDQSFFVEDRISHDLGNGSKFELSAGVRRDHFDVFGSQTSPRIAAAIVSGVMKWRAAYGLGFRAPSLGELYYPFFGNPNLKAESNRSYELGFDEALGRDGLFSLTYFNSRYRNLITFDPVTFISQNIGRVRSDGIEAGLTEHLSANVYAAFSYTYLHRDDDEATGLRLLRRPKNSGSISTGYRSGAIDTNIALLHIGQRDDDLAILPFSRTTNRAYTTIDLNVQYHLSHFTPFAKVENLANTQYEEAVGFASPSRRVILGLKF